MEAPSSPSLPPRNPTNPQMRFGMRARAPPAPSPSERHLRTQRRVTFCKRHRTVLNKVSELCGLTGARAAVIVLPSTGRLHFSGGSSVEEMEAIFFDYVRCNGGAMPPMGPKEGVEWVNKRRQRTEIAKIADQVQLRRTFSNRLLTIIKMTSELCTVADARAAVVVFPHTGFHYLFGNSSFENIIFDWVKKQRDSCKTEEDIDSLNLNYAAVLRYVREKLKDISGSGNSGVGADCDSEDLNDADIDSLLQSFKASHPVLFAHFKDYVSDGLFTSPVNSAVASGSSGTEPTRSVLVGCEFNPPSSLNLSENNPSVKAGAGGHSGVGVGHDDEVLHDEEIHYLLESFEASCPSLLGDFENCAHNGGHDSFLTSPVNLAAGGGSPGVESTSTLSELEGCGLVPDCFLNLSEEFVRDGFSTLPENSADDAGSSGEEPTCSDLEGNEYDPDIFVGLDDLDVTL